MDENFTNGDDKFMNGEKYSEPPSSDYFSNNADLYENFEVSENFAYADNYESLPGNQPEEKKYVITINKENIAYVDNLSAEQRTKLVNSLISNYRNKDVSFAKNITPPNPFDKAKSRLSQPKMNIWYKYFSMI